MARSGPGKRIAVIIAIAWLAGSPPLVADEIAIYESLSDVDIGRVFLSPRQRAYLDTRPIIAPRAVTKLAPTAPVEEKKNPAGYIISSTGNSSVWSRRGFVSNDDPGRVEFPSDIKVIRGGNTGQADSSRDDKLVPVSDGNEDANNDAP